MTRPAIVSRATRIAVAVVGTAGAAVAIAGCASATTSNADGTGAAGTSASQPAAATSDAPSTSGSSSVQYKNGTYTASGTYQTPQSVEKVTVSLTLSDDTVTSVKVTGDPQTSETVHYQGEFVAGISSAVVGKKIEDLSVTRVGGSSLTSAGFNDALAKIEAEAKA
jgi:uncharacterized protein with FMN-binding domain